MNQDKCPCHPQKLFQEKNEKSCSVLDHFTLYVSQLQPQHVSFKCANDVNMGSLWDGFLCLWSSSHSRGRTSDALQYPLQIMFWRTSALKQNYEVAKHQDLASHKRLVVFASCIRDAPLTAMSVSSSANSNYHCRFVIWRQDAHHFAKDGF
jgi:hypothetical protein